MRSVRCMRALAVTSFVALLSACAAGGVSAESGRSGRASASPSQHGGASPSEVVNAFNRAILAHDLSLACSYVALYLRGCLSNVTLKTASGQLGVGNSAVSGDRAIVVVFGTESYRV